VRDVQPIQDIKIPHNKDRAVCHTGQQYLSVTTFKPERGAAPRKSYLNGEADRQATTEQNKLLPNGRTFEHMAKRAR